MTVSEYLARYPEDKAAISDYRIGGYDVLSIIVYEEKDLSRESVRVTANGFITFPLIGQIKVADLTATEIERLISKMLAEREYLLDAHVSVMVVRVPRPGNFPPSAPYPIPGNIRSKCASGFSTAFQRRVGLPRFGRLVLKSPRLKRV